MHLCEYIVCPPDCVKILATLSIHLTTKTLNLTHNTLGVNPWQSLITVKNYGFWWNNCDPNINGYQTTQLFTWIVYSCLKPHSMCSEKHASIGKRRSLFSICWKTWTRSYTAYVKTEDFGRKTWAGLENNYMMEATCILLTISQFSLESSLEVFIISFNTFCGPFRPPLLEPILHENPWLWVSTKWHGLRQSRL